MYLNTYVKAWQDYVVYNRNLMQANMAAIQFGQTNRKYTMQSVFNALRQHTEVKKFSMMSTAVESDMNVAISETEQFNKDKTSALLRSNQTRAGNIVRDMLAKRLFAYFMHWNNVGVNYNQTMETKVKDKILKMYINYMKSYFVGWKTNVNTKERRKRMKIVQDM